MGPPSLGCGVAPSVQKCRSSYTMAEELPKVGTKEWVSFFAIVNMQYNTLKEYYMDVNNTHVYVFLYLNKTHRPTDDPSV